MRGGGFRHTIAYNVKKKRPESFGIKGFRRFYNVSYCVCLFTHWGYIGILLNIHWDTFEHTKGYIWRYTGIQIQWVTKGYIPDTMGYI